MYKAVGTTFVAKNTKRMLLNLRSKSVSYPNTWSFWGGKIEKGEEPIDALRREMNEEIGLFVKINGFRGAFPWAANYDSFENNNSLADYIGYGVSNN